MPSLEVNSTLCTFDHFVPAQGFGAISTYLNQNCLVQKDKDYAGWRENRYFAEWLDRHFIDRLGGWIFAQRVSAIEFARGGNKDAQNRTVDDTSNSRNGL
jgi:hypothetical protein